MPNIFDFFQMVCLFYVLLLAITTPFEMYVSQFDKEDE